jgi:8-oxo-dGTP pyrophosphatase MutT (NUDIX family)
MNHSLTTAQTELLTEQFLPRLLLCSPKPRPRYSTTQELRESAVIIPLIARPFGWSVLLTQRSQFLRHHPGQICFPGGKMDPDDTSLRDTALRELQEELHIPANQAHVLCRLPSINTSTGYRIHPFIARIDPAASVIPSAQEIAHVFEIPLRSVLDPQRFTIWSILRKGKQHRIRGITVDGWFIWGATANILFYLAKHVRMEARPGVEPG